MAHGVTSGAGGGAGEAGGAAPSSIDANVEWVRSRLAQRAAVGLRKYSVTTERADLSVPAWILHAIDELLDGAVYLRRLMVSIDGGETVDAGKKKWFRCSHPGCPCVLREDARVYRTATGCRHDDPLVPCEAPVEEGAARQAGQSGGCDRSAIAKEVAAPLKGGDAGAGVVTREDVEAVLIRHRGELNTLRREVDGSRNGILGRLDGYGQRLRIVEDKLGLNAPIYTPPAPASEPLKWASSASSAVSGSAGGGGA